MGSATRLKAGGTQVRGGGPGPWLLLRSPLETLLDREAGSWCQEKGMTLVGFSRTQLGICLEGPLGNPVRHQWLSSMTESLGILSEQPEKRVMWPPELGKEQHELPGQDNGRGEVLGDLSDSYDTDNSFGVSAKGYAFSSQASREPANAAGICPFPKMPSYHRA
ncbi:hypothetical protein A6R68_08278 [Neotoma lepida]|uniref:Uncharacterized protein n=1 Tax=Neotoma lepida TaxID=56216 RepID=A0A1A6G2Z7_NEOLE|nr:hypothetical protein A6R68_08278 [Neotoma lepida]